MKEINATYTKKQDLLRQQEQIYFNSKHLQSVKIRKCSLMIVPKHGNQVKESGYFERSSQCP